ncbi:helix-turn-helix domain-containing protein [Actinoplanes sp. CA-131856]
MQPTVIHQPKTSTVVVFRTTAEGESDVLVSGPRTRGSYHPGRPETVCVQVRLPPGRTHAVLGIPASDLVDRAVRLSDLWGDAAHRLTADLTGAADPELLLTEALAGPESDPAVTTAMTALTGAARLAEAATRAGVSERYLRTLFARDVGLSPKHYARISRVQRVLSLGGRDSWAAVADRAGYFDQPHMISDFRALMGVSPAAYFSGRLPPATPCVRAERRYQGAIVSRQRARVPRAVRVSRWSGPSARRERAGGEDSG